MDPTENELIMALAAASFTAAQAVQGVTLEEAKAVYLPKGAKKPKLLSEKEVAKAFPEEG